MTSPLEGVRILDLTRVLAGPYCTMLLGDLGADVIKVERPGVGDDLRQWGPPFTGDGQSTYFVAVNRNKRSITIDMQTESGQDLLRRLARESDVVVENFKAGTMERYGLAYEQLAEGNPGLVYCAISGFGHTGPLHGRPGYDVLVQAFSGLMSVTGEPEGPPHKVGVAIVDIVTGLYATIGIVSALQGRQATGRGRRFDVSLLESALSCLPNLTSGFLNADAIPRRHGNRHPNVAPYSVFPTRDGHLTLAVGNDDQWGRLCEAMGRPELVTDPRFATNADRVARGDVELDELVADWFRGFDTDDLIGLLTDHGVPHTAINTVDEALTHPQVEALGTVLDVPDNEGLRVVGSPLIDDGSRAGVRRPPPRLGEHSDAILSEVLGLQADEVRACHEGGALG